MNDLTLNRQQVRSVDRIAIEDYGIPGIVLMENAGRGTAEFFLQQNPIGPILILCGKGNNGGDGFVIARHLSNAGLIVNVVLIGEPEQLPPDAETNYQIIRNMEIPVETIGNEITEQDWQTKFQKADWIVDALLGTGTQGRAREPYLSVIQTLAKCDQKVLAVDVPSGLDCDGGPIEGATVRAKMTATFVALKPGLQVDGAAQYTGPVEVIDIGAPQKIATNIASSHDS